MNGRVLKAFFFFSYLFYKECYEKVDYWKKRFEDILSENQGLQELIDRSAQDDDDDDEKCEEANKNIIGEYRTLKFHLIRQQLENVATLRRMEALKRQVRKSKTHFENHKVDAPQSPHFSNNEKMKSLFFEHLSRRELKTSYFSSCHYICLLYQWL